LLRHDRAFVGRVVLRHVIFGGEGWRHEASDQQSGKHIFLHHSSPERVNPPWRFFLSKRRHPTLPFRHGFYSAPRKSVAAASHGPHLACAKMRATLRGLAATS